MGTDGLLLCLLFVVFCGQSLGALWGRKAQAVETPIFVQFVIFNVPQTCDRQLGT